jgi:hypothetical protein
MDWANILAPLSGGESDKRVVAAAAAIAEPFGAQLTGVYAPADGADLVPGRPAPKANRSRVRRSRPFPMDARRSSP